ncbi:MAG: YitT family protein [Lachnospiraceae bacterium]|nr:YitT family protein [Lachnospiraceae bacterium]
MKLLSSLFQKYFRAPGLRNTIVMLFGVAITGLGIALFRLSNLGTDPYSGMTLAISALIGMSYPLFQILVNVVLFIVQLTVGRKYIGLGTIINAFFLAYFVSFFYWIFELCHFAPENLIVRLIVLFVGMCICSLGLSMYQQADQGVAPYDALALILHNYVQKVPYFFWRILCDALCALACFLGGGVLGVGTLLTAFGFGPFIQFFDRHVSRHLLHKDL